MFRQIFVNLPIKDLARSRAFFEALGLTFNPRFSNEQGAGREIGENFFAMLLVDSRAEVEAVMEKAVAAGATTPNPPVDHGFMFQHGFADLDGHQWEVFWMDMAAAPEQM